MPLKTGKGSIGPNIKTEMSHGKPYKVALAIALRMAGGPKSKRPKAKSSTRPPKSMSKPSKKR